MKKMKNEKQKNSKQKDKMEFPIIIKRLVKTTERDK
jgi:hypothetical protein